MGLRITAGGWQIPAPQHHMHQIDRIFQHHRPVACQRRKGLRIALALASMALRALTLVRGPPTLHRRR
ncbi:hypothetical protein BA022_07560 [Diaphorobacter nitroreducens]|nr:hypothetical protein BA022_07560 [Diaphorobacter nitroreducens]